MHKQPVINPDFQQLQTKLEELESNIHAFRNEFSDTSAALRSLLHKILPFFITKLLELDDPNHAVDCIKQINSILNNINNNLNTKSIQDITHIFNTLNKLFNALKRIDLPNKCIYSMIECMNSIQHGTIISPNEIYQKFALYVIQNPPAAFITAEILYTYGYNRSFYILAETLERPYPTIALLALEKVRRSDPDFIDARIMSANIILSRINDFNLDNTPTLTTAYNALINAGNSNYVTTLRNKLAERINGGSGFDLTI